MNGQCFQMQNGPSCTVLQQLVPYTPKNTHNNNNSKVEPEMYNCTSNNWSHWNSNEKLKEKFGNCTRKTFDSFTVKDSYTWNITHNTENTAG